MSRLRSAGIPLLLTFGLVNVGPVAAGGQGSPDGSGGAPPDAGRGEKNAPDTDVFDEGRVRLFPLDDLYVDGLAGPHRRGFGVTRGRVEATDIADSGESFFGLLLGGRFGFVRVHPRGRPDRGWQLGIEAGFFGQFDVDRSYDNVGWDGFYGLAWTAAPAEGWAVKVGILHTSSHVGDEYAERTGRRRIGYTREELVAGVSRSLGRWRLLGEAGWAYDLRNEALQEAERLQVGVEYLAPATLWNERWGWYAAVGGSAMAERDWQLDLALDVGLLLSPRPRRWRLGIEYYDGRAPMGEFFQNDQRLLSLGLWLDL